MFTVLLTASLDIEAIDFFIKEAVAKIWRHTFANETDAQAQLEQFQGDGEYAKEVKRLFAQGYEGAKKLVVPPGYCFPQSPNLMQRYVAYLVQTRKRIGNWSGTGAGKTLSAILASRAINAASTVICCPNNVIDNWKRQIKDVYPDSVIYTKESMTHIVHNYDKHQYLILNYEFFQQPQSEKKLKAFLSNNIIDFIVIDEIHYSKQREAEKVSKRKQLIATFLSEASSKNDNLCVLGMSATPVINNLFEGKTLIELVSGTYRDDLDTNITIDNCIALYKQFVTHGIREVPQYKYKVNEIFEEIDCGAFIEDIKKHRTIVELESILTKAKLPCIIKHLKPKTIVYTFYRDGIDILLQEAIEQQGWKVAFFNGDDKEGLETFITGDTDVLIASSCIGTGIDRLQYVCNRLIVNCLPWTNSQFEQLKGRIYRQGQVSDVIDIIIPLTYIDINGERRSWCDSKRKRVKYKKDIADVAVDGVIPEGRLRTPEQAHKDLMLWLKRIDEQGTYELQRSKVSLQFTDDVKPVAIRRTGDLTKMNQRINCETSMETHKRFTNHPIEWQDYHAAYREARKEWQVIPYQEAIKWCQARPNMVIGDFGCGEAFLAQELQNKVYSFDHVAISDKVTACDMVHVPLQKAVLDAAIFSLSLMGTNWIDYLREAHRCLKLDGQLWIAEPTARFADIGLFKELLERLGFDIRSLDEKGKFTFITAIKSERAINEIAIKDLVDKNILN